MTHLSLPRPTGFSLAAAAQFFANFTPGSGMAAAAATNDALTFAFGLDGSYAPVAVSVRETPTTLEVDAVGLRTAADRGALSTQLSRMLGLEGEADAWLELGAREPVIGSLQRQFPGFFTAAKASPYDAATWAVIAPRTSMTFAADCKRRMASALGATVMLDGAPHSIFPSPATLIGIDSFPGIPDEKMTRLREVARAALAGKLDATRLRRMGETAALAELQTIRGVGPWAAGHIYFRGAAPIDGLAATEPRLLHGAALAYDLPATPSYEELVAIAETWRPFRSWVVVLLMRRLAQTERWNAPELRRERAAAGKRATTRLRARAAE